MPVEEAFANNTGRAILCSIFVAFVGLVLISQGTFGFAVTTFGNIVLIVLGFVFGQDSVIYLVIGICITLVSGILASYKQATNFNVFEHYMQNRMEISAADLTKKHQKFNTHPNYTILVGLSICACVLVFICLILSCFAVNFAAITNYIIFFTFLVIYVCIGGAFFMKLRPPPQRKFSQPQKDRTGGTQNTGNNKVNKPQLVPSKSNDNV